jgi:chromosomal replication initiator protein
MPSYAFDAFAVNDASRAAFNAAAAVAENPGSAHNPLALFGPTRSGKTHLLHAIEQALRARRPDTRVLRAPAQQVIDQIIEAIRHDEMQRFRTSIATLDALLLDDVWIGADKPRTLEELLRHFESVLMNNGQIVVTSHVAPDAFPILKRWIESHHGTIVTLA